jgi:hypothetical protein
LEEPLFKERFKEQPDLAFESASLLFLIGLGVVIELIIVAIARLITDHIRNYFKVGFLDLRM